jgi:hypothetical protein
MRPKRLGTGVQRVSSTRRQRARGVVAVKDRQASAWSEDAHRFVQRGVWVRHVTERGMEDGQVKRVVSKGQCPPIRCLEGERGLACPWGTDFGHKYGGGIDSHGRRQAPSRVRLVDRRTEKDTRIDQNVDTPLGNLPL